MAEILERFKRLRRWTRPYRHTYGTVAGGYLALQVRSLWRERPGTPVSIDVPGWSSAVWMRAHTSDLATFEQIVLARELDFSLPFTVGRIIDGGANVGFASIFLAQRFPAATILAVEFEDTNYELLVRNTAAWPNIRPVHAAIRGRPERVGVRNRSTDTCAYEAAPVADGGVEGVTLAGLMDAHGWSRVDLVKLDIEGSERDVLLDSAAWLERVQAIAVETHDRLVPGCQAALDDAVKGDAWQRTTRGEYQLATRVEPLSMGEHA